MKYTIEHLSYEELSAFLKEQAEDAFPDLRDEHRLNMLAEKWSTNAEICTCRDEGNILIGMIAFYANRPDDLIAYISHVYVCDKYRGQKIFTSMLNLVEAYVKEKGFHFFRLEVNCCNENAKKAYFNYGFSIVGKASDDSYYMQHTIS